MGVIGYGWQCSRLRRDKDLLVARIMKQEGEIEQLNGDRMVLRQRVAQLEEQLGLGGGDRRGEQEVGGGNMVRGQALLLMS